MITIMKRNLKLYFSERSTICYSLLTSLIVLVLYFAFLKQNYIESLKPFREGVKFADIWVLSGILSVTGMTACFHAISQLVVDKSSGRMNAFRLTQTSTFAIYMGCFLSSVIIGIIMQLAVFGIGLGLFAQMDAVVISLKTIGLACGALVLNSVVSSALSLAILSVVRNRLSLTSLGTLVGTLSGFLSGVYVPMGALPEIGQTIMKCYPGAYSASLFRQILLDEQLKTTFGQVSKATLTEYKATFGIGLSLKGQLTTAAQDSLILGAFSIGLLAVVSVILKVRRSGK